MIQGALGCLADVQLVVSALLGCLMGVTWRKGYMRGFAPRMTEISSKDRIECYGIEGLCSVVGFLAPSRRGLFFGLAPT